MAVTLYYKDNAWVTLDYLHDAEGYTTEPSMSVSYKSTDPWGGTDTTGYMTATDFYDIRTYELWKQGLVGWYSMDEMAVQGVYPDTAIETIMRNGNITSNAAYITDLNGVDYYIVQAAISEGWLTLDEWALLGWEPVSAVESPLCGSMGADYSESVMGYPAERMERGGIAFSGLLRENVIPESGTVEEDQGLVVDFGLRYASGAWELRTFESGYYYYSGVLSQDDSDAITGYGLEVYNLNQYNGPIGCAEYNDNYSYELIAVYSDIVDGHGSGEISFDPSILYCAKTIRSSKNTLTINGNGTFSTPIKCWRCRITYNN